MERSSARVRLLVADGIAPVVNGDGLFIQTTSRQFIATIARGDASVDDYRAALASIADRINSYLDVTAPKPKPEPIKAGDRVSVVGFSFNGKVQEIDDEGQFALVTFDGGRWDWVSMANVTKVPA